MSRVVAIGVAGLIVTLTFASAVLMALSWGVPLSDSWGFRGFTGLLALVGDGVALLIVLRRPGHPVGWLFLAASALSALQLFGEEYLIFSYFAGRDPLPAASWFGWLNVWLWVPGVAAVAILVPLYFPDGRLPAPAWGPVVWIAAVATILTAASAMMDPLQIHTNMRGAPPPYDARALPFAGMSTVVFGVVGFPLVTLAAFAAAVSVVRRFRRARGVERQQIKWFAFGALCVAAAAGINVVAQLAVGVYAGSTDGSAALWKPAEYLLIATMMFLMVSVGLAVLRYRLYDVDLVINRTLVYAILSAALGAIYLVLVIGLQAALRPLTGGSEIAVAASTLVVVALVQPLRRRIQGAVDRRFYRSRYDAARILDSFASHLRDEVDLDALRTDIVDVVATTVRPRHASLWLRGQRA